MKRGPTVILLILLFTAGCHYHTVHVTYAVPQGPSPAAVGCGTGCNGYASYRAFAGTDWEDYVSCYGGGYFRRDERDSKLTFWPLVQHPCQSLSYLPPVDCVQPVVYQSDLESADRANRPEAAFDLGPDKEHEPLTTAPTRAPTPQPLTAPVHDARENTPPRNAIPSTIKH